MLAELMEILLLLVKIFFSLNCQDLPEFFEDNMPRFMTFFQKYLEFNTTLLPHDESDAGPLEKTKSTICEIIDMYTRRYEEDFKMLPAFVQVVWRVLTTTSTEGRNDVLVSKAMSFLTAVVRLERHQGLFAEQDTLSAICSMIVMPNMMLRESDEELFEDDPIEFIRRDLEGSDTDTRRRAAADLVRGLLTKFEKPVTEIFSSHIAELLQAYNADPVTNWKSKDAALYLITSLSAKTVTALYGATSTNEYIQILPVLTAHIIPDLQAAVTGAVHPIIKVDAIKYVMIFRHQLTKDQILAIMPALVQHLTSPNHVVNTWTAHCIERILAMKQPPGLMFASGDIVPFTAAMLTQLFALIAQGKTPEKLAENDYLMKCVLRIVVTVRADLNPHVTLILGQLKYIIGMISRNPSNPKFNHYAFEALSSLVKYVCVGNPALVLDFEAALVSDFVEILTLDVVEFSPYIFQILSQLVCLHDGAGIPAIYQPILVALLQPVQWESHGNVPALVNLFNSFLMKGAEAIVAGEMLGSILGIFQKLMSSKFNDHHGFNLLQSIYAYVPAYQSKLT